MLVLTRKQKEEIHIGNNVTITILRIKGQSVRIGITAPRDVRVIRGELQADAPETDQPAPRESQASTASCPGSSEDASCRLATDCESSAPCQPRRTRSVQPTNTTLLQMARRNGHRSRQN